MATATTGVLTQTLAQLRARVAQRLGDYTKLTGTSNGTTTTFIDAVNINSATESMKGRVLLSSAGTVHFVTTQVDATSTITFTPAVSNANLVESGDTVELFNKRGKGFLPSEYRDAINAAINDAFPLGLIEIVSTIGTAFDSEAPEITVPAAMVYVSALEWEDNNGMWTTIPKASPSNGYGWVADAAAGEIRILGNPGLYVDGMSIRMTGYGRQEILTADSDTCALNAEYIVTRACYHLTYANIDRDEKFAQITSGFRDESARMRTRVRTIKQVGWELVRSV